MASASKKQRLDSEESAVGFVHEVSPMKTSQRGNPYFNAKIQEEDKLSAVVGHKEKMRTDLTQMETQRTPVKLSNIKRVPSLRCPGAFDIKLLANSQLSPAKPNFSFEKLSQPDMKSPTKKISEIKDVPEQSKVSVTAKVIEKSESTLQQLKQGRSLTRTTFVLADKSGSIELTLWGPAEHISVGTSYTFENVTVKFFDKKKLSTNMETAIKRVPDLIAVSLTPLNKEKEETLEVTAIKIDTMHKCAFCKSVVLINENLSSVKCTSCGRRHLLHTILTATKAELSGKQRDLMVSYIVPSEVLDEFCGKDMPNDDKEVHLLNCQKLRITVSSEKSQLVTKMKIVK